MKQFYFISLIALLFCVIVNAQQSTNPFEDILLSETPNFPKGTPYASAVLDTADFVLQAQRTEADSTVYTYSDDLHREGLILTQDSSNNWVNFSTKTQVLNANGRVIESIESLYENDSCCFPNSRRTIEYDEYNNNTYQLDEIYLEGAWTNDFRWVNEYHSENQISFNSREFWEEGQWQFQSTYNASYDDIDNIIFEENLTNNLMSGNRSEWEYNDDNQLISLQRYNFNLGEWELYRTITNTYNDEGQLENTFTDSPETSFQTPYQTTYEYDSLGYETYQLVETLVDSNFLNSSQLFKEYDDQNNIIEELSKTWYNEQWNNSYLVNRTFNEEGSLLFNSYKIWNNDAWENSSQTTRVFDDNGYLISIESFNGWNDTDWLGGTRLIIDLTDAITSYGEIIANYYYFDTYNIEGWTNSFYEKNYWNITFLGLEDIFVSNASLNIYPNPTQDIFQLEIDEAFRNGSVLEVFNLNGQLILTQNILQSPQIFVDLNDVNKGLYLVKLTNEVQQATSLLMVK